MAINMRPLPEQAALFARCSEVAYVDEKEVKAKLKEMGYKTFEVFIDESYDQLPTFERFDAIIEAIKKIDAIEDKMAWYKSMEDILTHNYNVLMTSTNRVPVAIEELQNYYNDYFKL
jgi:L-rhamnose mutarotase